MSQVIVDADEIKTRAPPSGRDTNCTTTIPQGERLSWNERPNNASRFHVAEKPSDSEEEEEGEEFEASCESVAKAASLPSNIEPATAEGGLTPEKAYLDRVEEDPDGSGGTKEDLNSLDVHSVNNNNHNNHHLHYLTNTNKELLSNFLLPYQQLFPSSAGLASSSSTVPWLAGKVSSTLPKNTCPYCGAVKGGPADLQRHIRKHTGERPFVCKVQSCGKAFKAKRSLQYHQFMNHGIETHNSNIGEKYLEARRRRVLSDHVRSVGTPPALSTAVQALFMLGNMSTGGGQSNVDLGSSGPGASASTSGPAPPPPPPKIASSAAMTSLSTGEANSAHASSFASDSKSLDQSQDSLNNNSPMERNTNRSSPPLVIPQSGGSSSQGVVSPTNTTAVSLERPVVDKNANYGAIKANNNNNNTTTMPSATSMLYADEKSSAHLAEYPLPTHIYQHHQPDHEKDHARYDGKRKSTSTPQEEHQGDIALSAPPPPKVLKSTDSDCNGESDARHSEDEEQQQQQHSSENSTTVATTEATATEEATALEFRCSDCSLIYQKLEWLDGHRSTHGGEQPYRCQVCAKGFRVKGRLLCHEKDVHDIGVRQVFTSDDHYNLRARARPVDYSLSRRSFDMEFEEDFAASAFAHHTTDSSPTRKPEASAGSSTTAAAESSSTHSPTRDIEPRRNSGEQYHQDEALPPRDYNNRTTTSEGSNVDARFAWNEQSRISGGSSSHSSSHMKLDSERVPIKTVSESLHPAFHKHLMSQVHHRSGSETTTHHQHHSSSSHSHSRSGMDSHNTRDRVFSDPHHEDHHHQEDLKTKEIRGSSFDSQTATDPSPTNSGPLGTMGMDFSLRNRERNFSDGSQSLLSSTQEKLMTPSQSSYEDGEIDISTHVVEYPSQFPGLKERISIKNETILVTKLNGINLKTGNTVALYKCYMCNKMFNKMSRLQCHMSVHFEHGMSVYTCDLCGATFKFRLQLMRHASRVHRGKPYAPPPLRRHRWHSQSSVSASVPPVKTSTVTSPEDYKTRSPLVTNAESPTEETAATSAPPMDHRDAAESTHLARFSDDHDFPSQEVEEQEDEEEEGEIPRGEEQLSPGALGDDPGAGIPYHGYPIGSIGSSLASSHPALHKYLYRRYRGTYVCQYCNKTFFRLFSLQKHEQVHKGLKPCYCKECGKGFSEPRNLRQHMLRYHSSEVGGMEEQDALSHSVRRLRRPISSGLPRTSQRLAPVTPDMIEEAERLEKQVAVGGISGRSAGTTARVSPPPPTVYDFAKLPSPTSTFAQNILERSRSYSAGSESHGTPSALTSPSGSAHTAAAATSQLKVDTTSPVSSHPAATPAFAHSPPHPSPRRHASTPTTPQPSPLGHLASQIRQKEKLSEDVVVIIPSDAPLDGGSEPAVVTPRSSTASDTPWWSEPGYMDTDSNQGAEVIHSAPRRSMMMDYRNQLKANRERRKGQPVRIPSPSDDQEIAHLPPQEQFSPHLEWERERERVERESVIREKLPSPRSPKTPRSAPPVEATSPPVHVSAAAASPTTMASIASAGMLFPGDLSNTTSPLGGALPPGAPPLYLGGMIHPGLLSPSTLPLFRGANPAALLHPGAGPPGLNALRLGVPSPSAWAAAMAEMSSGSAGTAGLGGGDPRMPTPYSKNSGSAGRNSSLRPRLNVVKIPVRREDACKPTLLPDGRTVYRCTYCSKDFGSFSDINRHMDFHEDIRPYKCKFCDYYARTNSQLKVHMMRHQGIREFLCKLCNYKGVTQSDLNRHMKSQIHMMKMQNECRLCGEGFVSPKNLEKHLAMCKGPKSDDSGLKREWKSDDPPLKREWSH